MRAEARSDQGSVELVYRPTVEDAAEMLRARMRCTPSGRRARLLLWLGSVGGLLLAVALVVATDVPPPAVAGACGLSAASLWLLSMSPRLQARQVRRMGEPHGEHRAVVDERGVHWTTEVQEVSSTWRALPRYTETPRLFVLFSGDQPGLGVACLPKRAVAAPGEADRLRAILDRHAQRV